MRFKLPVVVIIILIFFIFMPLLFAEDYFSNTTGKDPYNLSLWKDISVGSTAAACFFAGRYLYKNKELPPIDEVENLDKSTIFFPDRLTMFDYSKPLDISSGVTEYTNLVMPVGLMAVVGFRNKDLTAVIEIAAMYSEALLYALGVKDAIKGLVNRYRPYAYGNYYSASDISGNPDARCSFPSGHTTAAFTGAVFASVVFSKYYPDSRLKVPIWITSLSIATATGVLRVLSGNHFATDVIGGAIIGSFFGFVVPILHENAIDN